MGKAELESLADNVQRQWHGFVELQSIARIVEAHRKVAAAATRGAAPPGDAVQAVLREAAALQWLPRSPEQVSVCTRRAKSMLQPYQRDLLPATLIAVATALAGDAKTKQDPRLAQVRAYPDLCVGLPCVIRCASARALCSQGQAICSRRDQHNDSMFSMGVLCTELVSMTMSVV